MTDYAFGQFPQRRMRRLRRTAFLRDMVRESSLTAHDLIYPVFVLDGNNRLEEVASMRGASLARFTATAVRASGRGGYSGNRIISSD